MQVGAAQVLGAHHLAGGRLHQGRAAQEDGALVAHDDALVRHGRNVGATGRAGAHHHRDLRDAGGGQVGLVVEDPAEVVPVGKDLVLERQVGAAGVHEVDAGQAVLPGDFLGPQVLLHGDRVVGPALHGRVVGDDDALLARRCARSPSRCPRSRPRRRRARSPPAGTARGTAIPGRAARGSGHGPAACPAPRASPGTVRRRPGPTAATRALQVGDQCLVGGAVPGELRRLHVQHGVEDAHRARSSSRSAWRRCGRSSIRPSSWTAPASGFAGEGRQHPARALDLLRRRGEGRVDDRHLGRVDGEHAAEAVLGRAGGAPGQGGLVPEVGRTASRWPRRPEAAAAIWHRLRTSW